MEAKKYGIFGAAAFGLLGTFSGCHSPLAMRDRSPSYEQVAAKVAPELERDFPTPTQVPQLEEPTDEELDTQSVADRPTIPETTASDAIAMVTSDSEMVEAGPAEPAPLRQVAAINAETAPRTSAVELAEVGDRLALAATDRPIKFRFETLNNPRATVHHHPDGYIYVSSGMLASLQSADELAGVLALEMAKVLVEHGQRRDLDPELPSGGPEDEFRQHALVSKLESRRQSNAESEIFQRATVLLTNAGFDVEVLTAVRERQRQQQLADDRPRMEGVFSN